MMETHNSASHSPSFGDPTFCSLTSEEFTETQDLTWRLLDGVINDQQRGRLETLLSQNETARQEYIEAVQLHAGLLSLAAEL